MSGLIAFDLAITLAVLLVVPPIAAGHEWALFLALAGAAVGMQIAGYTLGIYDVGTASRLRRGGWVAAGLGTIAFGFAMLGLFGIGGFGLPALTPIIGACGIGACGIGALVAIRLLIARWLNRHAVAVSEQILLVGTRNAITRLRAGGHMASGGRHLVGVIAIGDDHPCTTDVLAAFDPSRQDAEAIVRDFWRIGEALRGHSRKIDRVVIVPMDLTDATLAATLLRLDHLPFEIALAMPLAVQAKAVDPLDRGNCLTLRRAAITTWGSVCKRALDVMAASMLLVCLAPMFLVIMTIIRLGSPGPALFRQVRWGWNNEPFILFKFRTMWADAAFQDGGAQATKGDKRITPFGAFLRNSSLDELPQLLNVLNGTMSLVGPRPHPVELNLRYLGSIDRYAVRHRVTPGITGLAQINGYRGETRAPSLMQKRVDYDIEYIRTRSLGADIRILLRTVGSVIRRTNAY